MLSIVARDEASTVNEDELRDRIRDVARRLMHSAELALSAARSPEPELGAAYLTDTVEDILARDFSALRRPTQP